MNNNISKLDTPPETSSNIPKVEVTSKSHLPDIPSVKPLQVVKEDKPIDNTPITQEPKSPRKEMVAVKNEGDIDETSSLANFFDDMKKIVEDKGIVVEKNDNKIFTLFEDANEVES